MTNINQYSPRTGRELKEDGTFINTAELLEDLHGSIIPEYGWRDTDQPITPKDSSRLAIGIEIDTSTGDMTLLYWDGSDWQEVNL